MSSLLVEHYRCPDRYAAAVPQYEFLRQMSSGLFEPYFRLFSAPGETSSGNDESASQLLSKAEEAIQGLRHEGYGSNRDNHVLRSPIARVYYFFRPFLPRVIRQYFQRIYLSDWDTLAIPRWPVDTTVDDLLAQLLLGVIRSELGPKRIPFIWFWPEGASSCAIMTHDVETQAGLRHCLALMDTDAVFGMPAAYQMVPEDRYCVSSAFLDEIKGRGFEVNIQDLNHDGLLFRDEREFRRRAKKINAYAKQFGARGFRSGALYRNSDWLRALRFEYDMSVPNVAHLDPQRGGCCTVFPYFIDEILELPLTTTQDYSLFHILNQHSLDLWKQQVELIQRKNGLISFITHPDYLRNAAARSLYRRLLSYLADKREHERVWITSPGELNDWWRQRAQLRIVEDETHWRIDGPGSERARIAYAEEHKGQLVFTVENQSLPADHPENGACISASANS